MRLNISVAVTIFLLCFLSKSASAGDAGLDALDKGIETAVSRMVRWITKDIKYKGKVTIVAVPLLDSDGVAIRRLGVETAQILNRHLGVGGGFVQFRAV